MPLFRKSSSETDAHLPLSVDQAAKLRRLVREAFASLGREVAVDAAHVTDDEGAEYGLWNLAVLCRDSPERKWPVLVGTHVGNLIAPGGDVEALPEEQLLDLVHLRLQPTEAVVEPVEHVVEEVVPGVPTVIAVDLPTMVTVPKVEFWADRGGVARWMEVGRRNLAALVGAPDIELHRVQQGDTEFCLLLGESFFTASLALVLDDVIRHYDGGADTRDGVLVAFPNRHQLVWRALEGPGMVPTVNGMLAFTTMGHDEGAGPVSRNIFWRHDGRWDRLATMDGGKPTINVTPEFAAVMERLI